MREYSQQECLALESIDSLSQFLEIETALAHLFDGYEPIAELDIHCFIDGTEATPAYLIDDAVALLEDVMLDKQAGERVAHRSHEGSMQPLSADGTKYCLRSIGGAAPITEERGSDHLSSQNPASMHHC